MNGFSEREFSFSHDAFETSSNQSLRSFLPFSTCLGGTNGMGLGVVLRMELLMLMMPMLMVKQPALLLLPLLLTLLVDMLLLKLVLLKPLLMLLLTLLLVL